MDARAASTSASASGPVQTASRRVEHADAARLSAPEWFEALKASVRGREIDGLRYPGFPPEEVQVQFVGSSREHALAEASGFHDFAVSRLATLNRARSGGYLDFGCGWGRIGRFFLREFERDDMAGVDIDPGMVRFCAAAECPGVFEVAENGRPLKLEGRRFRLITAYSVFTHLPPKLFEAWLRELVGRLAPGGLLIFTVEPPRFLDFIDGIDPAEAENPWQQALASLRPQLTERRAELAQGGATFFATGGGAYRDVDVYGETVVTPDYIARAAGPDAELVEHLDDPAQFWQAVAVVRRKGGRASLTRDGLGGRIRRWLSRAG